MGMKQWIELPIWVGEDNLYTLFTRRLIQNASRLALLCEYADQVSCFSGNFALASSIDDLGLQLAVPQHKRKRRSISVSAVPFEPGIAIWRSCTCPGSMFRAMTDLLGGMGRFLPCNASGNHCRLRHVGWEQCGHRETADPRVLGPLSTWC